MLYSWDHLNKIGPIKNNRLSVQIEDIHSMPAQVLSEALLLLIRYVSILGDLCRPIGQMSSYSLYSPISLAYH